LGCNRIKLREWRAAAGNLAGGSGGGAGGVPPDHQPAGAVQGAIRVTKQGEVIAAGLRNSG